MPDDPINSIPKAQPVVPCVKPVVLEYRPVMPRGRKWAELWRKAMPAVAIVAWHVAAILLLNPIWPMQPGLGGGMIGTPFSPIDARLTDEQAQWQYLPRALAYFAIFLLTQWMFLTPRGNWRLKLAENGPPSRWSAVAAGFVGMLLSIGLLATLMEIPEWWIALTTEMGFKSTQRYGIVWCVMAAVWAGWAAVFWSYGRSLERYTALRRIFRWLLAGSILEMMIAAPVHVWVYKVRGEECYCQRGSWTGVAFGCTAIFWLFGPGALLLFMREKRRREGLL
jgi:hypothetical protein